MHLEFRTGKSKSLPQWNIRYNGKFGAAGTYKSYEQTAGEFIKAFRELCSRHLANTEIILSERGNSFQQVVPSRPSSLHSHRFRLHERSSRKGKLVRPPCEQGETSAIRTDVGGEFLGKDYGHI